MRKTIPVSAAHEAPFRGADDLLLHDDFVLAYALTAEPGKLERVVSTPTLVVPGADPLREMDSNTVEERKPIPGEDECFDGYNKTSWGLFVLPRIRHGAGAYVTNPDCFWGTNLV